MIKSMNKLCIFISSIILSSVIIITTVFMLAINQESIFIPKAEATVITIHRALTNA